MLVSTARMHVHVHPAACPGTTPPARPRPPAGALCCFAYAYLKPFIRVGLGSAQRCVLSACSGLPPPLERGLTNAALWSIQNQRTTTRRTLGCASSLWITTHLSARRRLLLLLGVTGPGWLCMRLWRRRAAQVGPYAAYILWLCGSVFYHLPSLEALGFDIKADLSIAIVAFSASAAVRPRTPHPPLSLSMGLPASAPANSASYLCGANTVFIAGNGNVCLHTCIVGGIQCQDCCMGSLAWHALAYADAASAGGAAACGRGAAAAARAAPRRLPSALLAVPAAQLPQHRAGVQVRQARSPCTCACTRPLVHALQLQLWSGLPAHACHTRT